MVVCEGIAIKSIGNYCVSLTLWSSLKRSNRGWKITRNNTKIDDCLWYCMGYLLMLCSVKTQLQRAYPLILSFTDTSFMGLVLLGTCKLKCGTFGELQGNCEVGGPNLYVSIMVVETIEFLCKPWSASKYWMVNMPLYFKKANKNRHIYHLWPH